MTVFLTVFCLFNLFLDADDGAGNRDGSGQDYGAVQIPARKGRF